MSSYYGVHNTVREKRTPVDCLGYTNSCCGCIHVRTASILICIISFIWAIVEITQAETFTNKILPENNTIRKVFLMSLMLVNFAFLVVTGILMVGLIMHRNLALHIYVWGAFFFDCVAITLVLVSCGLVVFQTGTLDKNSSMKLVAMVIWCTLFFYFITVVNSYKMMMWQ